MITNDTNQRRL